MTSINELPSKILLRIFGLLDLNDLMSASRVSKKFQKAAEDGTLYQQVNFNRSHRLDDIISILRRQRRAIVACRMEGISDSNTILKYMAGCPNLRVLKLKQCDGERGIKEEIFEKLFDGTDIYVFALKNCELETFPRLKLKNMTSLSVVDNTGYQYPLSYVKELLPVIENNFKTLTSLKLCLDNISVNEKHDLFDKIRKCENLENLQFQYPHVDEIDEKNFVKLFNLLKLVSLSVVVSEEIPEKIYNRFIERPFVINLRKIEFGGNICYLLPSILQNCPHLEILRLTCLTGPFIRISNEELLNMLSTNQHLKEISLKSVSTNNMRHTILQLPTYLPHLKHAEIEVQGVEESNDNSTTPLKIEFNLLPNFALETQNFEGSTIYVLFRSQELLKFITSSQIF
ncbi:hypothetical protein PGB90_004913 [Kerria lacca]